MNSELQHHDDHGGQTGSSKAHVLPLSTYLVIGSILLFLTFVTVMASQFDFGNGNLLIAMIIAASKATLVALYFMHLKYDKPIFAIVFVGALIFLAIFVIFTMLDTLHRDDLYSLRSESVTRMAVIYDANGKPLPMDQRHFEVAQGQVAGSEDDVPFEIKHGYGPVKEEVKVGPLDSTLAMHGKEIFKLKCTSCHRLDERYTGPPLRGVTVFRSPTFIMNQILDPAQNVANHPEMQGLLAQYYTIMTNQNVTREDARALVEYLRWEAEQPPEK